MKFSRRKSLVRVEDEPVVRIPDVPVVRPEESVSKGVQQAHIRVYDDHATIVNQRVIPKPIMGTPIKPVRISPVKLPEKPHKEVQKVLPALPGSYEEYVQEATVAGPMKWGVTFDDSPIAILRCPLCEKEINSSVKPSKDIPSSVTTNIVCRDCWNNYLHKGILLVEVGDDEMLSMEGEIAVINEEVFKDVFKEAIKEIPNVLKFRTAVIPKKIFVELRDEAMEQDHGMIRRPEDRSPLEKKLWDKAEHAIAVLLKAKEILDEMITARGINRGDLRKEVAKELRKSDDDIRKFVHDVGKALDDIKEVENKTTNRELRKVIAGARDDGELIKAAIKELQHE